MKKIILLLFTVGLAGCASTPSRSNTVYYRDRPSYNNTQYVPVQTTQYAPVQQPTVYYRGAPNNNQFVQQPTMQNPQDDYNKRIIKQGLLGAGVGAISAGASGGKAGQGALIGAGTNIIGGALFDMLTTPQAQQQPQYAAYTPYANQWTQQNQNTQRIIRTYDSNGNVVSEQRA